MHLINALRSFLCLATLALCVACSSEKTRETVVEGDELRDLSQLGRPDEIDGKYYGPIPDMPQGAVGIDPVAVGDDVIAEAEGIGGNGDLKVTLLWDFPADIDLHVSQPSGHEIFFRNPSDPQSGGSLDVDNRVGGPGAAENVFWTNPPKGQYTVWIHYFQPSLVSGEEGAGPCTVVVMKKGERPLTYRAAMNRTGDKAVITSFTLL